MGMAAAFGLKSILKVDTDRVFTASRTGKNIAQLLVTNKRIKQNYLLCQNFTYDKLGAYKKRSCAKILTQIFC